MPADKIKDVYDLISDKGYFSDENEFRSYVSDPKKRKEVYTLIQDDGFFTDEKEFDSYFSDVKKKEPTTPLSFGYKTATEATSSAGLPKQEKLAQSPLKTAGTTTPSVSTKKQWTPQDQKSLIEKIKTGNLTGETPEEDDYLNRIGGRIVRGMNTLNYNLAKTPEFIYNIAAMPQNIIAEKLDVPSLAVSADKVKKDLGIENQVADYYKEQIDQLAYLDNKYMGQDGSVTKLISSGKYTDAAKLLGEQIAESLPTTAAIAASGGLGATPTAITLGGGAVFGAAKYDELADRTDLTESEKTAISLSTGLVEGLVENIGTANLGRVAKEIFTKSGADVAKQEIKKTFVTAYKEALKKYMPISGAISEGIEEAGTQFAQNAIDIYGGVDPNKKLTDGVMDALIVGTGSGAVISSPTLLSRKRNEEVNAKQTEIEQIDTDLQNTNISDAAKQTLIEARQKKMSEINDVLDADINEQRGLSEENKREIDDLRESITNIDQDITESTTDASKALLASKKQEIEKRLELLSQPIDEQGRIKESINRGTDVLEEGVGMAVEPGKEGVAREDIQAETVPQTPLEEQQAPEVISETVSEIEPPVASQTTTDVGGKATPNISEALKDVESTAKALENLNTFDQQDENAEVVVGKEKDRWGRSQVWRERIENAGDMLRELSGRGKNPDVKYLQEKIDKIKDWILNGSGFNELPKNIKTLKDVDESNVRFSSAVDGKEYLDKFHNDVLQETINAYKGIVVKTQEEQVVKDFIITLLQGDKSSIYSKLREVEDIVGKIKKQGELKSTPLNVSQAYHQAKADGSNPELVAAVEKLLGKPTAEAKPTTKPVAEQIADLRAAEQAEYDAMANPKDKAKRKEIYDKYDKLITPLLEEQKAVPAKEAAEVEVVEEEQYEPITVGDTSYDSFTKDNAVDYEEDEKEGDNGRTYTYLSSITVELLDNFSGEVIGTISKLKNEDGDITYRTEDNDGNEIDDNLSTKREAQKSLVDKWNKDKLKEFNKEKAKAAKQKAKEAEKAKAKAEKQAAKETAKPEPKKTKPEQIGEGLLSALGVAQTEESTRTEFQDSVKPQFKVDLNENLSEEQSEEVKKIFDEALDNPNTSTSEVVNIEDTIDPSIPTQKITISTTDNRPEASLMSKLRVPLDFIFGKSVGLGMSDTLTTGERTVDVMNQKTGKIEKKTIREEGGIGYPFKSLMDLIDGKISKGKKVFGWASVGEGAGTAMINAAKKANKISGLELKKLYFNNLNLTKEQKQRINDAIPDNKEYGLVSIYKMGNDGILSNEAHTREAFRQIETSLNESEKELFFKLAKERLANIKWEGKDNYINLINSASNFVELENILHGKDSKLPLGSKASIIQNVFLSTEKTVSTETGNKLGELLKSKGISIESVSRAIEEPAMKGIDKGQPMILLAIDPDSKVIEDVNRERHNNYPYGVEGFPIGVFNETTQMHRISPEMMDNFVKTATTTVDENAKKDGKNVRVSIYQTANGSFYAQEGTGVKKFSIKDKKGNILFGTSKEELLSKLKKEGYSLSKTTLEERYTQKINGTTFNNLLQKAKTGFISIFNNPKLSAQEKLVKYLQKAFPGISVEINLNEYKKLEDDFRAQKLFNKDGKSYGFVKDGRVYLNPEYLNNNTPIHEFGHVWNSFAKNYKPEIYAKGVELINGSKYQDFVLNDAQYQKLIKAEFGADSIIKDKATNKFIVNENSKNVKEIKDAVADEALAKAIGDKGELFVNEAQKRSFANWLNKLFEAIKQIAGFESMTSEEFQNLNLNKFIDAALKEILSGKKVSEITSIELSGMTKTSAKFSFESQNSKIKDYIESQRKAGESDKDIRAGIESVADKLGLTASDINDLMSVTVEEVKPSKGYTPKQKVRRMAARIMYQGKQVPDSLVYYTPTEIEDADAKAKQLFDELGLDNTVNLIYENPEWLDNDFIPRVAKVTVEEISKEQEEIVVKLKNTEDKNLSKRLEKLSDMKNMIYGKILPLSSKAGLSLAMYKGFFDGIPFDHVREVQRLLEVSNEKTKNTFIDVLNKLNLANGKAIVQVAEKVASTVGKSKVEKARANYESSKRALKDVWNRSKNVGIAETPWDRARKNLQFDKALAKAAKDFVVYKSVQFSQFIKEVSDMLGIAESDIDKDHLKGIFDAVKEKEIQKGIKGTLSDMDMSLKDLIVEHFTELQETEKTLVDKLKESFGLEQADAQEVANEVSKELRKLSSKEKLKAIKASGLTQGKWVDELLTLSDNGSLEYKDIRDEFAKKIGLRELTDEEVKKLETLAINLRAEKDPRKRASLAQDLEDYKHVLKARYNILDFLVSDYLSNLFASLGSNEVNFLGNFMESLFLLNEIFAKSIIKGNFKDLPMALNQFAKGAVRGAGFAKQVITEGKATYKPIDEIKPRGMFELIMMRPDADLTNFEKFYYFLSKNLGLKKGFDFNYKFWNRLLLSMDAFSGIKNNELAALYYAIENANKLGLNGQERADFINKELGLTISVLKNALKVAKELGYEKGSKEYDRLIQDLIIESRSEELKEFSKNYSKRSTLTQEPPAYTLVGAIASGINSMSKNNKATKFIFPVVNTFANLIIKGIERSPFEFVSLGADAMRLKTGNLTQEQLPDEEIKRRLKAATIATVAGVALFLMAGGADDEDKDFDIYGSGTGDKDLDASLRATGWKPYSIRFTKGGGYWSFEYTPIGFLLGLVGDMRDLARYKSDEHTRLKQMISKDIYKKNYDELDENEKLDVFNEAMSGQYKLDDGFLTKVLKLALTPVKLTGELIKSVGAISKIMGGDVDEGVKYFASTGRGILSPRYGGEIKDIFNNKTYDSKLAWTVLTSNVPFIEVGNVKLDGFGRDITKYDREDGARGVLQGLKYAVTRRIYNPSRGNEVDFFLAKNMIKVLPPSNDLRYTDEKYREYQVLRGNIAMDYIKRDLEEGKFDDLSPMSVKDKIDEILGIANRKAKKQINETLTRNIKVK